MQIPSFLLAGIEVALNRHLGREPAALDICASLEGRRIVLESTELDAGILIEPHASGARVAAPDAGAADVTARASALRWMAVARELLRGGAGLPAGLDLHGDADVLRRFSAALALVGIEPEEWLAPLVGGAAAHRLAGGALRWLRWGQRAGDSVAYSAAEYLREETRDLASAGEVEEWMEDVERLREDVDRLQARIQRLEASRGPA